MRVIAGSARGRPLRAPSGSSTRPTGDRVRESMFNMLASLDAIDGARVVDLFAGSGALGIEARSRGAAAVTFVDDDPSSVAAIRDNLTSLGWDGAGLQVVRADALRWVDLMPAADVVLADPPYAFGAWPELMDQLHSRISGGLVVTETGTTVDHGPAWDVVKLRRYGSTVVQFVQPARPAGPPVDPKGGR